jgi:hypothetical protein
MRLTMQRVLLFALLLTPAMNATAQVTEQNLLKPDPNDWLQYSGTYDAQRHSLLKQIDTTNVQQLQTKWAYHMAGAADLEAVPIVVDGVMYVSQYNRVDALDGRTGRLIWQYQRQPPARGWPKAKCCSAATVRQPGSCRRSTRRPESSSGTGTRSRDPAGFDNAIHLLDRANLKEVMYESKSPMQSDVDKRFTPEEFQDLLAFLTRQAIAAPLPAPARNGQPQGN